MTKMNSRQDKSLLLKTARAVVEALWHRKEGTPLRPRWPSRVAVVNTGGWRACIGNLGEGQPTLQIWLDHFSGHDARKFNFCFFWDDIARMRRLAARASADLPVHRRITEKDMERDGHYFLSKRLSREEFGAAFLEEYWGKWSFFGIYDLTTGPSGTQLNAKLCTRAADFFESVARTLPETTSREVQHEVYPQFENRKVVTSHLQRERSLYLANERKRRDEFKCQVCHVQFEKVYGTIGVGFAEAHHRIPLHRLNGRTKTRIEDLATVCANCHRMLHKMEGKRDDVERLRVVVKRHKKK